MSEPYIPPRKTFPDGDYVAYRLDADGNVKGQLYRSIGKPVRSAFPYEGPDPAPWDRSRHIRATCVHCPGEDAFNVATLPLTLTETGEVLSAATCPNCEAGAASLRVSFG